MLQFLISLAVSTALVPGQTQQERDYRLSADVELVVLDVAVVDRKGRYVRGLTKENFVVFEEGRAQSIALFESEDIPVAVGIIVDSSFSMGSKRQETIEAALVFLEASRPEDEIFVVNFNENASLGLPADIPFTADAGLLRAALTRMPIAGRTALYDAIALGLEHIARSRYPRKFLIVFSDGGDNQSRHTLQDIRRRIQESGVTVYTIGLFDADDPDRNPRVLRELARMSGGSAFLPGALRRLPSIAGSIAAEIRSRYVIGYRPSERGQEGDFRGVEVRVSAPGRGRLEARTRPGYRTPRRG